MPLSTRLLLPRRIVYPQAMRTAYSYTRLSSPEQLKGSGLSRQIEAAVEYCRQNNLTLDATLKLSDEGLSAFDGTNLVRGRLGMFLKLVDSGEIKQGAVLIVESIDRLSRQNALDAQELFLGIINRGITIVTLMDRQEYSRETITKNPGLLFMTLGVMIRANEESETKSHRVRKSFEVRRKMADSGRKFRAYCPPWCDWDVVANKFAVDPEKAAIIKRMFQMYLDGKGAQAIASALNAEGVPYFSRGSAHTFKDAETHWYKKVVVNLLRDKRLTGYAHWIDRADYFPCAISVDLFNQVQARVAGRRRSGGQIGKGPVNILAGLLRCGHCGGAVSKNRCVNRSGYEYFYYVCENARSGKSVRCPYRSILFDAIRDSLLYLMRFRPWFYQKMAAEDPARDLANRIEQAEGHLLRAEGEIAKYIRLIDEDPTPPKAMVERLKQWENDIETTKSTVAILKGMLVEHQNPAPNSEFFEELPDKLDEPDYCLKIREVLRGMIVQITLHVHDTEFPHYQIARTNGNWWTVVFENPKRRGRLFHIFKGRATSPNDGAATGCELVYSGSGKDV